MLLDDFSGLNIIYLGVFTALRPEVILWRVRLLIEILEDRRATLETRVRVGLGTEAQARFLEELLSRLRIWLVVTTNEDKLRVEQAINTRAYHVEVFSVADVESELEKLGN
jgi:hypothetical protein